MTDLSHWLTDADACARLGLSARSLDREAKAGRLHPMNRPVEGRRPERVWNPEEIQARVPKMPAQVIVSGVAPRMAELSQSVAEVSRQGDLAGALVAALERVAEVVESRAPQFPALWMTIPQASVYSGLSQALLRRLIAKDILPSLKDRSTKVRRKDLDDLVNGDEGDLTLSELSKWRLANA